MISEVQESREVCLTQIIKLRLFWVAAEDMATKSKSYGSYLYLLFL